MAKKTTKTTITSSKKVATEKKGFTLSATKAIYDRATKTYTTKETLAIKAMFAPANKNHKDMVVFSCRGCAIVCTEDKEGGCKLEKKAINLKKYDDDSKLFLEEKNKVQANALKKLLLKRFNLSDCSWETLMAKCEPIEKKIEQAIEKTA